jgi:molybdenum cofactor cytidylyltransferase
MELIETVQKMDSSCIAFVGAGGKTTAMFHLSRQLPGKVIVTATTHLAESQLTLADIHFTVESPAAVEKAFKRILKDKTSKVFLFTGELGEDERAAGLSGETLDRLHQLSQQNHFLLLIEADGSRQKPLKAPGAHEPAIPEWVDTAIVVAGLSGLGKPLNAEWVHRPEIFTLLSGLPMGAAISMEALARVLTHPEGGLKSIPPAAQKIALLNQVDTPALKKQAYQIEKMLLPVFDRVIISSFWS